MKILITSDYYAPEINGVVTSILNLKKGLEEDGHEVRVLTLANNHHAGKAGEVYYLGSFSAAVIYPNARIAIPKNYKCYLKEIINWRPDVIHSQCEFSTFQYARYISRKTGSPIIHTYHTVYEGYTHYFCPSKVLGKKVVSKFTREVSKHTSAFIVPTEKMYDMLAGYRVKSPMKVIPSGISLEKFTGDSQRNRNDIRAKYGIDESTCLLIFLGRLAREKNVEELLEYVSKEDNENLQIMIVGDGPYREDLEKKAIDYKVENKVIFTGMVDPEKVYEYYCAADIFVSASTSETQGLTYIEAMASGLPILCRNDNCLDNVVNNEINGCVYNNQEEFHKYVNYLANNGIDRRRIGSRARKTIFDKFSVESFVKSCENLYLTSEAIG